MSKREKLVLEFEVRSSPNILFNYLSTPSGLVEWFCDDVNIKGKQFKFIWEGEESPAEVIRKVNGKLIRYKWVDGDDEEYFEFEIKKDELTGDISLVVTDYVDEDEVEDIEMLWESQIQELRGALGA